MFFASGYSIRDYDYYDWLRVGAVLAVAAVVGFGIFRLVLNHEGDRSTVATARGVPVKVAVEPFGPALADAGDLRAAAGQVGHPVYWAGRHPGGDLEFTLAADGRAYVRYLTGGAQPGDGQASFLTVATYGVENAQAALEEVAQRPGRESFATPGGGLAVVDAADPRRVYFTPGGADLQIEVFDPEPGRARALVASGGIQPVS